ncbi:inositol monophosphatase [bacterium]|nr:inositol monophosphatase [bacterium]
MNKNLKIIINAAKSSGEILKKYFGKNLKTTEKGMAADFFTKADIESEKNVLKILKKEFPDYNIYSEESEYINNNSEYTFYIDPLDGTNNFVLGISNFSISIALVKNNETILGVVYNPITDQLYYAEKNKGAFLNNKKTSISQESNIQKATLAYNQDYTTPTKYNWQIKKGALNKNIKRCISNWSPALDFCMLASGKIEACIINGTEPLDCLAGKLIAQESDAIITDFNNKKLTNNDNKYFIVSNTQKIHKEVLDIVKKSKIKRTKNTTKNDTK